jgi:vacuolar-type H+-ATPase subunit I/STV1
MLVIFPHPMSVLTGQTFSLFQTLDEVYLQHSYNDLLSLLLAAKVYIIFRSLLTLTTYSSPRASRLCHQNSLEHNLMYIIKCVLHEQPLMALAVCFGILMMVCGYCLKLSEGVLFLYNPGVKSGF